MSANGEIGTGATIGSHGAPGPRGIGTRRGETTIVGLEVLAIVDYAPRLGHVLHGDRGGNLRVSDRSSVRDRDARLNSIINCDGKGYVNFLAAAHRAAPLDLILASVIDRRGGRDDGGKGSASGDRIEQHGVVGRHTTRVAERHGIGDQLTNHRDGGRRLVRGREIRLRSANPDQVYIEAGVGDRAIGGETPANL